MKKSAAELVAELEFIGLESEVVDAAIKAEQLVKSVQAELDTLKDGLRMHGMKLAAESGANNFKLYGGDGHATVSFVKSAPKPRKSADMDRLQKLLGADFERMFKPVVSYEVTEAFLQVLAGLDNSVRDAVASEVSIGDCHVRVSLKAE